MARLCVRSCWNNLCDIDPVRSSRLVRHRKYFDLSALATALDPFVTVPVELLKVFSQLFLLRIMFIGRELLREPCQSLSVELVHVGLQVAKLCEDLTTMTAFGVSTAIKPTLIPFLASSGIGQRSFPVWSLSDMPSFMRTQIAKLRKCLPARSDGASVWLFSGMGTKMDLKMGGLRE